MFVTPRPPHFGRFLWHWKAHGLRDTGTVVWKNLRAAARQYFNRRWDRRFHVDTTGIVPLDGLTCSGDKTAGIWHEPTPIRTLAQISLLLPRDPRDFTFVDFGSGKGRTLLYASRFAFRRIVGVEFAQELHAIAERNFRAFGGREQRCVDIRSVCMDAASFEIPAGNCVFYFFHPFGRDVMARVLGNMERSYREHPRAFLVLYYHPLLADVFEEASFLRKRAEITTRFDLTAEPSPYRRRLAVYETTG